MKYKIVALAILAVIIYSCAAKSTAPIAATPIVTTPTPAPKVATVSTVLTPELMEGKNLYENNCAKCHRLYETNEFSAEDWKPIVERMKEKAHLDDIAGQKIYNYVSMK